MDSQLPKVKSSHTRPPYWLLGILLFTTTVFVVLALYVHSGNTIFFDDTLARAVRLAVSPTFTPLMRALTHAGDKAVVALFTVCIAIVLYVRHSRSNLFLLISIVGGSAAINMFLKLLFQRVRPDTAFALIVEDGFSFPSGHAMASAAFAAALIVLFRHSKWRLPISLALIGYMLMVGFSRVYLGVHYPSDVIAGFCASIAWAAFIFIVAEHSTFLEKLKSKLPFKSK